MNRPPPKSTLFPYTTLFRSVKIPPPLRCEEFPLIVLVVIEAVPAQKRAPPASAELPLNTLPDTCSVNSADAGGALDRKSTRLNSSHSQISYAVFCLKKKTRE